MKQVALILAMSVLITACTTRNIPRSWRPVTVEEKALKWAVKLCHQFGYEEESEQRRKCIARRYDQYVMEHN